MSPISEYQGRPNMFCSSLRDRPVWRVIGPVVESAADMNLQESCLETHDFIFPLPDSQQKDKRELRIILVTPSSLEDTDRQDTLARLERFSTLAKDPGNSDIAIAFLNSEEAFNSASGRCKLGGLMSLQVLYIDPLVIQSLPLKTDIGNLSAIIDIPSLFEILSSPLIPIIPVAEPSALFPSIHEYVEVLGTALCQLTESSPSSSVLALLGHVTANGPSQSLSQHDINVVSDLFPSLSALSSAVRTQEGRQLLSDYLGDGIASNIVEFWEREWICG